MTAHVEATVYQRLDDSDRLVRKRRRGELKPILSQVARVIEAAAMANDKQRALDCTRDLKRSTSRCNRLRSVRSAWTPGR